MWRWRFSLSNQMNGRRSPFYYSIRHIFMWNFLPPHRFTYSKFLQLFYFQLLAFYCTCSTVRNGANFNGIFLLKKMATSLSVQLQGRRFGEYSLFKWADCNSIRLNWIGFIVICTPTCWHRKKITGEAFKYSNFACYVTALHQIDFFSLAIDFGSKLSSSWHRSTHLHTLTGRSSGDSWNLTSETGAIFCHLDSN